MPAWLEDHPPRRRQYRQPRRATPSGVTVLHTAENVTDLVGPDTGAEAVAGFIRTRSTPGSYHDLVDRDTALRLVPYDAEAYQDGTGTNPHALSISWAISCRDWPRLSKAHTTALLEQGALAFVRQQAWLALHGYPLTPLRRISAAGAGARVPGFVKHGDRDPGRRSDPGDHFPWQQWLDTCRDAIAPPDLDTPDTISEDTDMRLIVVKPATPGGAYLRAALMPDGKVRAFESNAGAEGVKAAGVPEQTISAAQYAALQTGLRELGL